MARFIGTVQGGRGEASRIGHNTTGLRTSCRGWHIGVNCEARPAGGADPGADSVGVRLTTGSSGSGSYPLGRVDLDGGGEPVLQLDPLWCEWVLPPTPNNLEALRANKPLMDALFAHLMINGEFPREPAAPAA